MKPDQKDIALLPESERVLLQEAFSIAKETGIKTVDFAAQRLRAVLTIGHTLSHWRKRVPYSQWYPWLELNVFTFVEIEVRTVTNWMRLADAETSGRIKIESGIGVRAALIQAGICPANDKTAQAPGKVKGIPALIHAIVRVSLQSSGLDTGELDEQQRSTLEAALLPLVKIYHKIATRRVCAASGASDGKMA